MNRQRAILVSIVIVLIISAAYAVFHSNETPDTKWYQNIAKNLYQSGKYSYDGQNPTRVRQPMYPLFLLVSYYWTFKSTLFVMAIQILMNLLCLLVLYKCAEIVLRKDILSITPIVLALYFPAWVFAGMMVSETLFILLLSLSVYFALKTIYSDRYVLAIISGLLAGMAFLTRAIGFGYLIVLVFLFGLFGTLKNKRFAAMAGLIASSFIVACLPWMIRNYAVFDKFTPFSSDAPYHIYNSSILSTAPQDAGHIGFNPAANPGRVADSLNLWSLAVHNIQDHPGKFLLAGLGKNADVWFHFPGTRNLSSPILLILSIIFQALLLILALAGLAAGKKILKLVLICPAVGFSLIMFFTHATTRFTIPAVPFLLFLDVAGLFHIYLRIFAGPKSRAQATPSTISNE